MSRPENFNPGPGTYFKSKKKIGHKKGNTQPVIVYKK